MTRLFFDIVRNDEVSYDYQGRCFEQFHQARDFAELIALDIGCSSERTPPSAVVEVRDVRGQRLFSVPIPQSERIAA